MAIALIVYINDLLMSINHCIDDVLFVDDTSVLITDKNYDEFKLKVNLSLSSISQWFDANQLVLNVRRNNHS
jgi:hypothetical protein